MAIPPLHEYEIPPWEEESRAAPAKKKKAYAPKKTKVIIKKKPIPKVIVQNDSSLEICSAGSDQNSKILNFDLFDKSPHAEN